MTIPIHRAVPRLARNPLRAFQDIGARHGGAIVRLNLGFLRPYLLTDPGSPAVVRFYERRGFSSVGFLVSTKGPMPDV